MSAHSAPVLAVEGLTVVAPAPAGELLLLDRVSLAVGRGEMLCVVGESGSGKSLSMLACMGMLPAGTAVRGGAIRLQGRDLHGMAAGGVKNLRGVAMSMVFQDPLSALNPIMRVGAQIEEALLLHRRDLGRRARRERVTELLRLVHIANPVERARSLPHEISGGMRQRVMIAMAMAHNPAVLIADEPTTALDVTVQAQILALLREMRQAHGTAQLLITHDLGVVAENADHVAVLYSGRVVERGTARDVFHAPGHPYTIALLASLLRPGISRALAIPGQPPMPAERPSGCAFRTRCALGHDRDACAAVVPPEIAVAPGHQVACLFPDEARDRHRAELAPA